MATTTASFKVTKIPEKDRGLKFQSIAGKKLQTDVPGELRSM